MGKIEDWIKFCHYYRGEKENPYTGTDNELLWFYESIWVKWTINQNEESLSEVLEDYIRCGLGDFSKFDDTPITLKAILFNRYTKYNEMIDVDGFKNWYNKVYSK